MYPEEAAQWRAGAGDALSMADPRIAEEVRLLEAQRMPGAAARRAPRAQRQPGRRPVSDIDPAQAAWAAEFAERVRSGEFADGQGGVGFKAEAREAFDRLYPEESALLDAQLGVPAVAAEAALAADEQEVGAGSPPVEAAPADAVTMAPPEALDALGVQVVVPQPAPPPPAPAAVDDLGLPAPAAVDDLGLPVPAAAPAAAAMVPPEQLDVMGVEVHLAPPPTPPTPAAVEASVPADDPGHAGGGDELVAPLVLALTPTEVEAGAVVVEEVPETATLDNGFDLELASAVAPLEPIETGAVEAPAYEDGMG